MQKKAIIIGAGPAGLTAALELLEKTDIIPIILKQPPTSAGFQKPLITKESHRYRRASLLFKIR